MGICHSHLICDSRIVLTLQKLEWIKGFRPSLPKISSSTSMWNLKTLLRYLIAEDQTQKFIAPNASKELIIWLQALALSKAIKTPPRSPDEQARLIRRSLLARKQMIKHSIKAVSKISKRPLHSNPKTKERCVKGVPSQSLRRPSSFHPLYTSLIAHIRQSSQNSRIKKSLLRSVPRRKTRARLTSTAQSCHRGGSYMKAFLTLTAASVLAHKTSLSCSKSRWSILLASSGSSRKRQLRLKSACVRRRSSTSSYSSSLPWATSNIRAI